MTMNIEKRIDTIFSKFNKKNSPGAHVAISKDGEIIFEKGYGSSQLEYNIPITNKTIFHVASVSKQFTAFCILLLEKEGLIDLDESIQTYIPEFPKFEYDITTRHLLHHVSGLRDQWQLLVYSGFRMDDVITHNHIMKLLVKQKELNFKPGTNHLYCNSGYTLMAEIVNRITGKALSEFAKEKIFEPLKMKNTHFHHDHEHVVKNRAYSYIPYYDTFKKKVLSYANVGATSLFTTTSDLIKWSRNFDEPIVGDKRLIEKMVSVYTLEDGNEIDYACGLRISLYRGEKTIGHGGADAGFRTHFLKFPKLGYTIVVLTNLATSKPEVLVKEIADTIIFENKENETYKYDPISDRDLPGVYIVDEGNVINIEQKENTIYIHLPRNEKSTISKVSDNLYKIDMLNENIIAKYDQQGNVELLLKPLYGKDTIAKEVNCKNITNVDLEPYVGTYYSEELSTTYYLVYEQNELKIRHWKMDDIPLLMIEKDIFEGKYGFARIKMVRNDINKLIGFKLSGGRVKNIYFEKV
jgi:CubicO group peptidase (beta-lactamase class C family)